MEVAAGLLVAEQVISTTIEGGVMAGYALSKPTLPLKATYTCVGHVPEEMSSYVASSVSICLNIYPVRDQFAQIAQKLTACQ